MDILWLNKIAIISTKHRFNIKPQLDCDPVVDQEDGDADCTNLVADSHCARVRARKDLLHQDGKPALVQLSHDVLLFGSFHLFVTWLRLLTSTIASLWESQL